MELFLFSCSDHGPDFLNYYEGGCGLPPNQAFIKCQHQDTCPPQLFCGKMLVWAEKEPTEKYWTPISKFSHFAQEWVPRL